MNIVKLLPYGIANFKQIRRDNNYLVDKTMFIPVLERTANFLFLIRPRRFGKSLFLNMLHAYYDINDSKNFDQLFGGLWIADHPNSPILTTAPKPRKSSPTPSRPASGRCLPTPCCIP